MTDAAASHFEQRSSANDARMTLRRHLGRTVAPKEGPSLCWVPVHPVSRTARVPAGHWLEELRIEDTAPAVVSGRPDTGTALQSDDPSLVFYPVWVFEEQGGAGRAALSGTTGGVLLSRFAEDRAKTYARFVFILLVAAFGLLAAAFLFDQVVRVATLASGGNLLIAVFAAGFSLILALAVLRLFWAYYGGTLAPALTAVIAEHGSYQVAKALPELGPFLRSIGWFPVAASGWSSLVVVQRGAPILTIVSAVGAFALSVALLVRLRREAAALEAGPAAETRAQAGDSLVAGLGSLISLSLPAWLLAMMVTSLYSGTFVGQMSSMLGEAAISANTFESRAVRLALVVATLLSGLRIDRRAGLAAGLALPLLLAGVWAPPVTGGLTVVVIVLASKLLRPRHLPRLPPLQALERGFATAFFGHAGRIVGAGVGGLVLGTAGIILGSVMGEQLGMGLVLAREEEAEAEAELTSG